MTDNELERSICEEAMSGKYRHYGQPGPKYIEDWIDEAAESKGITFSAEDMANDPHWSENCIIRMPQPEPKPPRWMRRGKRQRRGVPRIPDNGSGFKLV